MESTFTGGILGLALGVRHTLEPDHVAAVGTFVPANAEVRRATAMGAWWGLGHSVALLVLGSILITLRTFMPSWLDASLELVVGIVLIGLGLRTILTGRGDRHRDLGGVATTAARRPFAVGLVHGAAGSGSAVVLAVSSMTSAWTALAFLGLFAVGSAAGMAAIAAVTSIPIRRTMGFEQHRYGIFVTVGLVSIVVGLWWTLRAMNALVGGSELG